MVVPVASIVSLSVVQIVNGFVTRNGHRHVGLRNENPGRPPAVCTKVTAFARHGGLPLDVTVALGGQHDPQRPRGDRREPHELVAGVAAAGDPSVLDVDVGAEPVGESELAASPHAVQIGERQRRRRVVVHDPRANGSRRSPGIESDGIQEIEVTDRSIRINRADAHQPSRQRVIETPVATPGEQVDDAEGRRRPEQRLSLIR